jgi:hypothetical protein
MGCLRGGNVQCCLNPSGLLDAGWDEMDLILTASRFSPAMPIIGL